MNKSFKVVFSKARGALMVVNELTSSVQAKGTKTVLATAVASALMAGVAMAAEGDMVINGDKPLSGKLEQNVVLQDGANVTIDTSVYNAGYNAGTQERPDWVYHDLTINGGRLNITSTDTTKGGFNTGKLTFNNGEITVGKSGEDVTSTWGNTTSIGGYKAFDMNGGVLNLNAGSRVWIGSNGGTSNVDGVTHCDVAMNLNAGTINMNGTDDALAIIGTMVTGKYAEPDSTDIYYQALNLAGADVNVNGVGVLLSRDINMTAGQVTVAKDATLHVLGSKRLGGDKTNTNDAPINVRELEVLEGSVF